MMTQSPLSDWWQSSFPQGLQHVEITDANGRKVAIAYGEKGQGKPLVLVHGIASWSYSWRHVIEPLSQQFRVICFDAKGYGFSDKPLEAEKPGHQIAELEQIVRSLCDQPAILVAQSLGALSALAVAQNHPELVDQLVLINVPIFPNNLPSYGMRFLSQFPVELIQQVDQWRLAFHLRPIVEQIVWQVRREVIENPAGVTTDDVYWISYPYIEFPNTISKFAEDLRLAAQEIRNFQQQKPSIIRTIQDNLGAVTCPTLVLWSDRDRWFPLEDGKKLQSCLPKAQLQVLSNCGHDAAANCPGAVNAAILSFLK